MGDILHVVDFVYILQIFLTSRLFLMIVYINARFLTQQITGVQRYGIECSRQIKKLCPSATLLVPKNILSVKEAEDLGAKIIGTTTGHFWEQYDLPKYLAGLGSPPLINLCNTAPVQYYNNYYTLHDLAFYWHPEWNSRVFAGGYKSFVPVILRRCKHIFTVSNTIKSEIQGVYHVPDQKISVTYNGIPEHFKAVRPHLDTKQKTILSVGTFNARKNQQKLLSAFLQSNLNETCKLQLVGGYSKNFKYTNIDDSAKVCPNIQILSDINEDQLLQLYLGAEIVASVSLYEGFGIPLLEGLVTGCKIICSDIPVYKELFTGFASFCNPNDINSICSALQDNALIANNINESKVNELLDKYNYSRSAKTILDTIENLG